MTFQLPDLPYAPHALASLGMSEETLKFHHDLHHKAYVDNLNNLIGETEWQGRSLEDIVTAAYDKDAVTQSGLFNNASQHWNHTLFWEVMGPGESQIPDNVAQAIAQSFGSIDLFREEFLSAGASQFGSGWVWLVRDRELGALKVTKTENGVNPLCFGQQALLGCDVWEHSYYIDFRNKRPAYLQNFLDKLVDWNAVASRI